MKEIQFSIQINASKERVWAALWDDMTFRDWAGMIDEGTYMEGPMEEGNEIQFISSVNGYGVTSLVEKLHPQEFILFRHHADTKESGQQEREKEWTGGAESYALTEKNGVTALNVKIDVPLEQEETMSSRFPKALERIKSLAEKHVKGGDPMEKVYQYTITDQEIFENIFKEEKLLMNHVIVPPGKVFPKHPTDAYVYALITQGELSMVLEENEPKTFKAGQLVSIPKGASTELGNRGEKPLELFVVKYEYEQ